VDAGPITRMFVLLLFLTAAGGFAFSFGYQAGHTAAARQFDPLLEQRSKDLFQRIRSHPQADPDDAIAGAR